MLRKSVSNEHWIKHMGLWRGVANCIKQLHLVRYRETNLWCTIFLINQACSTTCQLRLRNLLHLRSLSFPLCSLPLRTVLAPLTGRLAPLAPLPPLIPSPSSVAEALCPRPASHPSLVSHFIAPTSPRPSLPSVTSPLPSPLLCPSLCPPPPISPRRDRSKINYSNLIHLLHGGRPLRLPL